MIQNERSWETHIHTVWISEIQKRFTRKPHAATNHQKRLQFLLAGMITVPIL